MLNRIINYYGSFNSIQLKLAVLSQVVITCIILIHKGFDMLLYYPVGFV